MLGEVNHLMKGLTGPMLKSVGTGGDHEVDEGTGLLDGGATRPLRQEPSTRSRTRRRSRWSWLMEPRSSIKTL